MKKYPLFLILVPIFPVLSLLKTNLGLVEVKDSYLCIFLVWSCTLFLFLIILAFYRKINKAAVFTTLLTFLTLSYGHILTIWPKFSFKIGTMYIGPNKLLTLFLLVVMLILFFMFRKMKNIENLLPLNSMALVLVILPLISIIAEPKSKLQTETAKTEIIEIEPATIDLPPIYYFILDAYTRADILSALYHFDNTPFINNLRQRGFYVADSSYSNYAWTMMSIPSSLNFNYLKDIPSNPIEFADYTEHLVNEANIVQELRKLGYHTVAFDNSNFRWTTMNEADQFIQSPGRQMNLLLNRLVHMTPFPYIPFLKSWSMRPQLLTHYEKNRFVFNKLEELAKTGDRSFTFVHFLAAHRPFIFDAQGNFKLPENEFATFYSHADAYTNENLESFKEYYTAQVTYYSNRLTRFIDNILQNSPIAPIIILQADHGTATKISITKELTDDAVQERFAIFNAYYFPDQNYERLSPSITPVNSFRVVLNQFYHYDMKFLPAHSYYASGPRKTDFINVTDQLKGEK